MDQILLECKQGRLTAQSLTSYAVSTPGLFQHKDREGVSLLHWVSLRGDLELLETCLTFGADVNVLTPQLQTPLMWAAIHGHTGVIQQLFSSGCDLNLRDSLGATSLVLASQHGQVRCWLQLCDLGADPRVGDGRGCTSAHWAAYSGHTDLLRVLNRRSREMLSEVDNDGWTPLHRASRAGSFECVAYLVGEVGLHPCVQQAGVCPPPFSTAPIHTPLTHSEESLRAEAAAVMAATQALESASAAFKAQAQRHPSPQSMAAMQAMGAAQEGLARAQRRHGGLKAVVAFLSREETWRNEVALGGLKGAWAWGTACLQALFSSKFAAGRGLYPLLTAAVYVYALLAVLLWVAPPFFSLFFFLAPVGVYSALCLHAGVGEGWRAHSCGGVVVVAAGVGGRGGGGGGGGEGGGAEGGPSPSMVAFEEDRWTSINPIRLTLAAVSQFTREGVVTREGCSSALRGEGGGALRHILLSVVSGGGWLHVGRSVQRMLASSGLVGGGGGRGQGSDPDPVEPSTSSSGSGSGTPSTSSASGGGVEGDVEEGRGMLGEGGGVRRGSGGGDVWAHLHRGVVAITPLVLTIRAWLIEWSPSALSTLIERLARWITLLPFLKVHTLLPPPIPSLATFNPQAFTTALTRAIADAPPPPSSSAGGEGEGEGRAGEPMKTPTQMFLATAGALALEDKLVLSASTSSSSGSSSSSSEGGQQPPFPPSPSPPTLPLHTVDHTNLLIHPLRATHCPVAGKVYSRYDHFSFPLGVPIGAGNHRAYMALLVINWVLCLQLALGTVGGASRHAAMNVLLIQESTLFNAAHSVTPNSFSAMHLAELRATLPVSTWGVFWGGNWFAHLFSLLLFSWLFFRLTGAVLTQARHLAANITLYEASTLPSHPTFLSLQWSPPVNQIIPAFYNPFSKTTPLANVEDGLNGGVSPLIPTTTTPPLPQQLMDPLAAKVRFLQAQQLRATAEAMAKHMGEVMGGGGRGGGAAPPHPTTTTTPQSEQSRGGGESLEDMPSVPTGNLPSGVGMGGGMRGGMIMPKMQLPTPDMLVSRVAAMHSSYYSSGAYAKLFLAPPHASHGQGGGGGHSHGGRGGGGGGGGHSHQSGGGSGGGGSGGGGSGGNSSGGGHSHGGRECHGHH